MIDGFIATVN